jgi:hypothetical protein
MSGLTVEAVAMAEMIETADAVMMHTDAHADRADVNANAVRRSADRGQGNKSGDQRRFENSFHSVRPFNSSPLCGGERVPRAFVAGFEKEGSRAAKPPYFDKNAPWRRFHG